MTIGTYSWEEYVRLVTSFHGSVEPGLMIGGLIVDLALKSLPEGERFDAICETLVCLPDAVQLLTPCTIGNGRLTIMDFGKFAATLYEKTSGEGTRVFLDTDSLGDRPEINAWYFKLAPAGERDQDLLLRRIRDAGHSILGTQRVRVNPAGLRREKAGASAVCPECGESYPARHGTRCRGCAGGSPFLK